MQEVFLFRRIDSSRERETETAKQQLAQHVGAALIKSIFTLSHRNWQLYLSWLSSRQRELPGLSSREQHSIGSVHRSKNTRLLKRKAISNPDTLCFSPPSTPALSTVKCTHVSVHFTHCSIHFGDPRERNLHFQLNCRPSLQNAHVDFLHHPLLDSYYYPASPAEERENGGLYDTLTRTIQPFYCPFFIVLIYLFAINWANLKMSLLDQCRYHLHWGAGCGCWGFPNKNIRVTYYLFCSYLEEWWWMADGCLVDDSSVRL